MFPRKLSGFPPDTKDDVLENLGSHLTQNMYWKIWAPTWHKRCIGKSRFPHWKTWVPTWHKRWCIGTSGFRPDTKDDYWKICIGKSGFPSDTKDDVLENLDSHLTQKMYWKIWVPAWHKRWCIGKPGFPPDISPDVILCGWLGSKHHLTN